MHVQLHVEVSDQVIELALAKHKCGNAERAVELLLCDVLRDLGAPAAKPKSTKAPKSAKRR